MLETTRALGEFSGNDYDVIFFVGGFGVMWDFPFVPEVDRVAREVYERGGIVSAVCHGPIALANVKLSSGEYLVKGKSVAGFCNEEEAAVGLQAQLPIHDGGHQTCEDVLQALGGLYSKGAVWGSHVCSQDRVITGQNPASAHDVGAAVVRALSNA